MKKNTLEAIRNYLNGDDTVDLSTLRDEVNDEWNRLNAKREANKERYNEAHDIVINALTDVPVTVKELYSIVKNELPEGMTQAKIQYALLRYWDNEIEKIENGKNPNTYKKIDR